MMVNIPYYPEWLGSRLIDDAFDWEIALETTVEAFLEQYTLHDSSWIGFHLQVDQAGAGLAIIRFDAFWTDGRIPHPSAVVEEWPILVVRFAGITEVQLTGFGT